MVPNEYWRHNSDPPATKNPTTRASQSQSQLMAVELGSYVGPSASPAITLSVVFDDTGASSADEVGAVNPVELVGEDWSGDRPAGCKDVMAVDDDPVPVDPACGPNMDEAASGAAESALAASGINNRAAITSKRFDMRLLYRETGTSTNLYI